MTGSALTRYTSYLRRSALAETGGCWNCALGTDAQVTINPGSKESPKGQNESVPNLLSTVSLTIGSNDVLCVAQPGG
jgi:hypothetical protein